ncbi:MAG: hypothetical protein AAGA68_22405 [Pseudomonadota bacterium]
MDSWNLEWDFGALKLLAQGGMLADVTLKVGAGRRVAPFYQAPWLGNGESLEPELLENLRSEFPCVPFGGTYPLHSVTQDWRAALAYEPECGEGLFDATDELLHGACCLGRWELMERSDTMIRIGVDYPESSIIARLERSVRCDPSAPRLSFDLDIHARSAGRRPIGIHPNLAFPKIPGNLLVEPAAFAFGAIHPAGPEAGVSRAQPGGFFDSLGEVPLAAGGTAPFDRLPFAHDTEEILQLCGMEEGWVRLTNQEDRAAYTLTWDASIVPSLQLWISNRGRAAPPWSSRNMCLGVEPLAGVFDLGTRAGVADNPVNARGVATAVALDPRNPISFSYAFEADAL